MMCDPNILNNTNFIIPPKSDDTRIYLVVESGHPGQPTRYVPAEHVNEEVLHSFICLCPSRNAYVKLPGDTSLIPITLPSHMMLFAAILESQRN